MHQLQAGTCGHPSVRCVRVKVPPTQEHRQRNPQTHALSPGHHASASNVVKSTFVCCTCNNAHSTCNHTRALEQSTLQPCQHVFFPPTNNGCSPTTLEQLCGCIDRSNIEHRMDTKLAYSLTRSLARSFACRFSPEVHPQRSTRLRTRSSMITLPAARRRRPRQRRISDQRRVARARAKVVVGATTPRRRRRRRLDND